MSGQPHSTFTLLLCSIHLYTLIIKSLVALWSILERRLKFQGAALIFLFFIFSFFFYFSILYEKKKAFIVNRWVVRMLGDLSTFILILYNRYTYMWKNKPDSNFAWQQLFYFSNMLKMHIMTFVTTKQNRELRCNLLAFVFIGWMVVVPWKWMRALDWRPQRQLRIDHIFTSHNCSIYSLTNSRWCITIV